jgi:hypothetical protein
MHMFATSTSEQFLSMGTAAGGVEIEPESVRPAACV